jgi:hypothetical protein
MSDVLHKLPKSALLVLLLIVIPALIGGWLGGPAGAPALVIGMVGGTLGSMACGVGVARRYLPVLAAALLIGGWSSGQWWWVIVVAAFGAFAGWTVRWGQLALYVLAGIIAATALPISTVGDSVITVVFVLIGGYLGTALAQRQGAPAQVEGSAKSANGALVTASVLGLAAGMGALVGYLVDPQHGYWIPMTILLLAPTVAEGHLGQSWHRIFGTLAGLGVVGILVLLNPPAWVGASLAMLSLTLIFAVTEPYWLQTLFITLFLVLVAAPPGQEIDFSAQRLAFTLIGVAILLLIAGVAAWTGRRVAANPR